MFNPKSNYKFDLPTEMINYYEKKGLRHVITERALIMAGCATPVKV